MPLPPHPPGQPARRKAKDHGVGLLLSMPVLFFPVKVSDSRQHNTRDGDRAEHSCDWQQVQQEPPAAAVLPAKPPSEQLPRGMIVQDADLLMICARAVASNPHFRYFFSPNVQDSELGFARSWPAGSALLVQDSFEATQRAHMLMGAANHFGVI